MTTLIKESPHEWSSLLRMSTHEWSHWWKSMLLLHTNTHVLQSAVQYFSTTTQAHFSVPHSQIYCPLQRQNILNTSAYTFAMHGNFHFKKHGGWKSIQQWSIHRMEEWLLIINSQNDITWIQHCPRNSTLKNSQWCNPY